MRKEGGWAWVKLVEVRQEGLHSNKGLRLPRLAGERGTPEGAGGKAC